MDNEFLKEIEHWRLLLARNIALRNSELNIVKLNYAVQLIIDRIIFLRIAEDRGIERYGRLQKLLKKENIYQEFSKLCKKADEKYNSGLFHFTKETDDDLVDNYTLELKIDNKVFKEIFKHLYYPESPYEFSVFPLEILGQVYEQFLGKTIRLTPNHQAKVEEKEEVKKAGGIYYTPQFIVKDMVKDSIGEKIKDKTPSQIRKLRIIDPACGSGSFLIGAYEYLLDYHLDYYTKLKKVPRDVIYQTKNGEWKLTIKEKKEILKNNIYGVDLDPLAVEVTKLSLLLKVLEDQNKDTLEQQQKIFQERVLPNLSDNIKCGNSIISPEELTPDEVQKFNAFDWKKEYPTIFNEEENNGFDIVIGNPPYVRHERIKEMKPILKEQYKVYQGTADLYVYFYEKGLQLLRGGGILTYITSNKYTKTKYAKKLRKFLLTYYIKQYIDLTKTSIFKASVDTSIIQIEKNNQINENIFVNNEYLMNQKYLTEDGFYFIKPKYLEIKDKINKKGNLIKNIESIRIYFGIKTGNDKIFVIDKNTRNKLIQEDLKNKEIIKPMLKGRNLKKYKINYEDLYIILTGFETNIKKEYPTIYNYLSKYKSKLEKRSDKGKKWYNLRACSYYDKFRNPKLIYGRIAHYLFAVYDSNNYYIDTSVFMLSCDDIETLKIISALFSSKVLNFTFRIIGAGIGSKSMDLRKSFIEKLPLKFPENNEVKNRIIHLVDSIQSTLKDIDDLPKKAQNIKMEEINKMMSELDQIIYDLYNLNDEDIGIIEDFLKSYED